MWSAARGTPLVRAARHVVDGTPHADRITIIEASASDALERGLLPIAPDVIFAETLDCGVVGGGFLSTARDIQRIAGPHTIVMPNIVRQFAMLVDSAAIADLNPARPVCGFDRRTDNAPPPRTTSRWTSTGTPTASSARRC